MVEVTHTEGVYTFLETERPVFQRPAVFVTARFHKTRKNGSFLRFGTTVNTVKNFVNISQIQNIISRPDFEKALLYLQSP